MGSGDAVNWRAAPAASTAPKWRLVGSSRPLPRGSAASLAAARDASPEGGGRLVRPIRGLVLFLLLFASAFALPRLGTDYRAFWNQSGWQNSNPYILSAGGYRIMAGGFQSGLDSLSMHGEPASAQTIRDALGGAQPGAKFEKAGQHAQRGKESLLTAQAHYDSAKILHKKAFEISLIGAGAFSLSPAYPPLMLAAIPDANEIKDYAERYQGEWSGALSGYFLSYAYYSEAVNQELSGIEEDRQALIHAGLLSPDYRGTARQGAIDFNSAITAQEEGGTDYADAAAAIGANSRMLAYLARAPNDAGFGGGADFYWGIAGRSGTIAKLASLHSQFAETMREAAAEIEAASVLASDSISSASGEITAAKDMRSELVTPSAAASLVPEGVEISPEPIGPQAKLSLAQTLLSRARGECSSASGAYSSRRAGYMKNALELYASCAATASQSAALASHAAEEAASAASAARGEAEQGIENAKGQIAELESLQAGFAQPESLGALLSAKSALANAESLLLQARAAATAGERFVLYAKASFAASRAISLSSAEGGANYSKSGELAQQIHSLSRAISSAKSDGIDAYFAEQDLLLLQSLQKTGAIDPELAIALAQSSMASLLSAAALEYSDSMQKLLELLPVAQYYSAKIPSLDSKLAQYGSYSDGASVNPSALGKLASMRRDLQSISNEIERLTPGILGAELSRNAKITDGSEGPAIVGKAQRRAIRIETMNSLPVSYAGPLEFSAQLPFGIDMQDVSSPGGWVTGVKNSGAGATFTVNGADSNSMHSMQVQKQYTALPIKSESEKTMHADQSAAIIGRTVKFESQNGLPGAVLEIQAPAGSSAIGAEMDGRTMIAIANSSGIFVLLEETSKGAHELIATYSVPEPIAISRESPSASTSAISTKISYILSVSPPKIGLDFAQINLREPGAAGAQNFKIAPMGALQAKINSITDSGEDLLISMALGPVRKGETQEFAISYELGSLGPLDESLRASAERTGDREILSSYSAAHLLYSQGKFESAYGKYLELGAQIGEYQRAQDAKGRAIGETEKLAAIGTKEADAARKNALALISKGKYEEALAIARDALSSSEMQGTRLGDAALEKLKREYAASGFSDSKMDLLLSSGASQAELESVFSSMLSAKRESISATLLLAGQSIQDAQAMHAQYSGEYSALGRQASSRMPKTPSQLRDELNSLSKKRDSLQKAIAKQPASSLEAESSALLASANLIYSQMNSSLLSLKEAAESSYSLASAALDASAQNGGPEAREIRSVLADSESALEAGKYAESISLSRKALSSLALVQPSGDSPFSLPLLAASTAALIALCAWVLLAKPGKSAGEKKRLEKLGEP